MIKEKRDIECTQGEEAHILSHKRIYILKMKGMNRKNATVL